MTRPDGNTEAQTAYGAWVQSQSVDGYLEPWGELPAAEQDAWRRAVRLLAMLGLVEVDDDAPL